MVIEPGAADLGKKQRFCYAQRSCPFLSPQSSLKCLVLEELTIELGETEYKETNHDNIQESKRGI